MQKIFLVNLTRPIRLRVSSINANPKFDAG